MPFSLKPFPKRQILDSSKLTEFADDNFKFNKKGRSSQNGLKTMWEKKKLLVTSNFFFSHSVFKRLVLQTRQYQGLFGKGLNAIVGHFLNYRYKKDYKKCFDSIYRNALWRKLFEHCIHGKVLRIV